jgi:hypothetical protein
LAEAIIRVGNSMCKLPIRKRIIMIMFLDDRFSRLLWNGVFSNRQPPVRMDKIAGVAGGIPFRIVLILRLGLPEAACQRDLGDNLAKS